MKSKFFTGLALMIIFSLVAGVMLAVEQAWAGSIMPTSVETFDGGSGLICFLWPDGSGDCYCPCEGECDVETIVPKDSTPTDVSKPTSTPIPTSTLAPTNTLTPGPTATDQPPNTSTPEPTEKVKCDQGRGNGDDGCSPGNSDNQHDPNDPQKGPRL